MGVFTFEISGKDEICLKGSAMECPKAELCWEGGQFKRCRKIIFHEFAAWKQCVFSPTCSRTIFPGMLVQAGSPGKIKRESSPGQVYLHSQISKDQMVILPAQRFTDVFPQKHALTFQDNQIMSLSREDGQICQQHYMRSESPECGLHLLHCTLKASEGAVWPLLCRPVWTGPQNQS